MEFIPYKSNETLENRYYQVPQELFKNPLYKYTLNSDSKMLYAFILDRLSLSQKNHWIDKNNNIYLIFPIRWPGGTSPPPPRKPHKNEVSAENSCGNDMGPDRPSRTVTGPRIQQHKATKSMLAHIVRKAGATNQISPISRSEIPGIRLGTIRPSGTSGAFIPKSSSFTTQRVPSPRRHIPSGLSWG